MPADDFYSDLPSFSDFSAVGSIDDYRPVPDDWIVLAADIVRSSDAIAGGRYKDVNMIGAAVIAAILNAVGSDRVPFVFGGDGAMLIIPAQHLEAGKKALSGVVDLARQVMELELRAAAIPVSHIRGLGGDIRIRKYLLSPGNHLAMIIGDGLQLADQILKDPDQATPFVIAQITGPLPPLDGLSCKWEPLPAVNGQIASLIVKPTGTKTLTEIVSGLAEGLGFNPLTDDAQTRLADQNRLKFRFPPKGLGVEVKLAFAKNKLKGWLEASVVCLLFLYSYTTGRRIGPFDPKKYFQELGTNTDHRKVGDSLQLVLDLTPKQLAAVQVYLEDAYKRGDLVYGLHISDEALMTCFVEDIGKSKHIHFVDGADGGLSLAATQFKARQKAQPV
ncbi:DUF3095 domain-containing protein [Roseibium denhamense]|uniref:DUF3095 domain-containing protein n=1 Tax=Roseibium denhamense TaxID=76305 RepID=A0ABY1P7D9_9HYPH|nr:DUF3095 family protein [Roseibium denhamense]MTI05186.1 DUF3095 domain-containing protein [Roseibium denhamense]SMP25853.1 Protein of unknown function [Roseibium denhamense]